MSSYTHRDYMQTFIHIHQLTHLYTKPILPKILSFCKNHGRKWKVASGKNSCTACSAGQEDKTPSVICTFIFHFAPQQCWYVMSLELNIHQEKWSDTHHLLTAKKSIKRHKGLSMQTCWQSQQYVSFL